MSKICFSYVKKGETTGNISSKDRSRKELRRINTFFLSKLSVIF